MVTSSPKIDPQYKLGDDKGTSDRHKKNRPYERLKVDTDYPF